jgi:hypothetical protein
MTEDPAIWRGRRGFHALLHSSPRRAPAGSISSSLTHGWSEDGISWNWSPARIGKKLILVLRSFHTNNYIQDIRSTLYTYGLTAGGSHVDGRTHQHPNNALVILSVHPLLPLIFCACCCACCCVCCPNQVLSCSLVAITNGRG